MLSHYHTKMVGSPHAASTRLPLTAFLFQRTPHGLVDPCREKMRLRLALLLQPPGERHSSRNNNCLPWVCSKAGTTKQGGAKQELRPQKHPQAHSALLWGALVSSRCHELKHLKKKNCYLSQVKPFMFSSEMAFPQKWGWMEPERQRVPPNGSQIPFPWQLEEEELAQHWLQGCLHK